MEKEQGASTDELKKYVEESDLQNKLGQAVSEMLKVRPANPIEAIGWGLIRGSFTDPVATIPIPSVTSSIFSGPPKMPGEWGGRCSSFRTNVSGRSFFALSL